MQRPKHKHKQLHGKRTGDHQHPGPHHAVRKVISALRVPYMPVRGTACTSHKKVMITGTNSTLVRL